MRDSRTIFLYSNNNYEFAYKLKQICKNKLFALENVNNFADLFFNFKELSVPLLFVDGSNLKDNKEIASIKEDTQELKKLIFIVRQEVQDVKNILLGKYRIRMSKYSHLKEVLNTMWTIIYYSRIITRYTY